MTGYTSRFACKIMSGIYVRWCLKYYLKIQRTSSVGLCSKRCKYFQPRDRNFRKNWSRIAEVKERLQMKGNIEGKPEQETYSTRTKKIIVAIMSIILTTEEFVGYIGLWKNF